MLAQLLRTCHELCESLPGAQHGLWPTACHAQPAPAHNPPFYYNPPRLQFAVLRTTRHFAHIPVWLRTGLASTPLPLQRPRCPPARVMLPAACSLCCEAGAAAAVGNPVVGRKCTQWYTCTATRKVASWLASTNAACQMLAGDAPESLVYAAGALKNISALDWALPVLNRHRAARAPHRLRLLPRTPQRIPSPKPLPAAAR